MLFLVFVVGNYQQFLDANLIFLIRTSAFSAILCVFFSLLGLIVSVLNAVICTEKRRYIVFSGIYFLTAVSSLFFLILLAFFDVLSSGV